MLEDMKKKAIKKKQELLEANETDTKFIDNIIKALNHEQIFNDLPQSTCFNIFIYLGYPVKILEYVDMYNQLMEEVNKKYIYVNPDDIKEVHNGKAFLVERRTILENRSSEEITNDKI